MWKFIENEIWVLTFGAISRGSKLYKGNPSDKQKNKLRKTIKNYVRERVEDYRNSITKEKHLRNIKELCETSRQHRDILENDRLSIGRGQKLLNLYLKYLWCLDEIPEPPHCPLDRDFLQNKLNIKASWTKLDKLYKDEDKDGKSYQELIEKAREKAREEGCSVAKLELKWWNRQRNQ